MDMQNLPPQNRTPWHLSRSGVLVLLFFVAGILALPLLAKSPDFTKRQKTILSILVSLYTLALFAAIIIFFVYMYRLAYNALYQ